MLDRSRYACRDIEFWTDGLPCLADLMGVRDPPFVHRSPRCSHGAAERFCELFDQLEIPGAAHAAASRYDDIGLAYVHGLAHFFDRLDDPGADISRCGEFHLYDVALEVK